MQKKNEEELMANVNMFSWKQSTKKVENIKSITFDIILWKRQHRAL